MKKTLALAGALLLATTLAACGSSGDAGGAASTTTIKVGDNWGATHPMSAAIDNVFKKEIEEKTDGAIKVEVFHAGQLGNESDLWDAVRNGTLEVAVVGSGMNQEWTPMLISDWPFLYRDVEHAKNVWTGEVAEEMNEGFHEKFPTVYSLAWGPNSARTFTSSKKLESVADFQGQKFRMPSNPIHVGIAENLGASAQVIPLGELFSALETGVVDGQDNGMVTVISEGFYEVQDYVYETNHIVATLEVLVSAPWMDKLTEEQQQIVKDAATNAAEQAWDDYIASIDTDREFLRSKGVTVTELTDEDRALMIEKIKPLTDQLMAENDWAADLTAKIAAVK